MVKNKDFQNFERMSRRDFLNEKMKWFVDKPNHTLAKLLDNRHGIFYSYFDFDDDGFDLDGPCPCCGCDCQTKQQDTTAQEMLDNNLKNILTAIENGADVNQNIENIGTPLHWTTWQYSNIPGALEIMQKLIQHGADVNALDKWGNTPLHGICDMYKPNDIEAAKILIEAGCDVNIGSPLVTAADRESVELVKYLISVGADVNQKDKRGNTPLSKAIKAPKNYSKDYMKKYNEIVKVLVEAGADLTDQNEYGRTPYYLAINNKNKKIIKYLESKGTFN